jgi:hypothetical protein
MTNNLCSICLENLQNGEYLFVLDNCYHTFHYYCVNKYVDKLKNNSSLYCPLCRSNFRTIGFQKVDLNIFKNSSDEDNIFNKLPSECLIYENVPISKKLSEFLSLPHNCLTNRLCVTKKIYKYMNDNNLIIENNENGEKIFILDEKLKDLFIQNDNNTDNNNHTVKLNFIHIQNYLSNHIGYFTEDY